MERGDAHVLTDFEPGGNLDSFAVDPNFALAHDLVEMGLRQIGIAAAKPAVGPHARFGLPDWQGHALAGRPPVGHPRKRPPKLAARSLFQGTLPIPRPAKM